MGFESDHFGSICQFSQLIQTVLQVMYMSIQAYFYDVFHIYIVFSLCFMQKLQDIRAQKYHSSGLKPPLHVLMKFNQI